jgi:uncharacterized protein YcbK (DUF882 family)
MITKDELLKGRDKQYPKDYTKEVSDNLDKSLILFNKIRIAYGMPMIITSGWRPSAINGSTPGAAAHSKHVLGMAMDVSDPDGKLWKWVLQNLDLMQQLGIYMEDRRWTKGWVHFGVGAPASGKRIFIPNASRASDPDIWDGKYDHSFDKAA